MDLWNIITAVSGVLMIILILVQTRGANLSAGLGGGGELNTVRRGSDLSIYRLTVIMAVLFVGSILGRLII
jgi:preprotein translocase subunit SecG